MILALARRAILILILMRPQLLLFSLLLLTACTQQPAFDPLTYVDPYIGTGAHYSADAADLWGTVRKQKPIPTSKLGTMAGYDKAHDPGQCIPAVFVPHGMNFWVAQTEDTEQKEISPYYYQDQEIQGFRNSHWIVGGMTQDYGSFTLMPLGSELIQDPVARGSAFSHDREVTTPYYYSVDLERYGIRAEMTATSRAALFRFTYREAGDVYLVVNPNSDEGLGRVAYNPQTHEITGSNPAHRIYQGWGEYAGFDGHFTVSVNKEILEGGVYAGDSLLAPGTLSIDTPNDGRTFAKGFVPARNVHEVGAYVKYHVEAGETVLVKAASSFTDIQHAQQNLAEEIPAWDFTSLQQSLRQTWHQTLSRIEAQSTDTALLTSFYTALYHASFLPRQFSDCDGSYPPFASSAQSSPLGGDRGGLGLFTDYSLWDTYRALHPLIVLLDPDQAGSMVQSMLDMYDQGGWLPIFPCWNSYTSEMIGDHCCSLVADAYFKGVRNFDVEKAYEALIRNAYQQPATFAEYEQGKGRRALQNYIQLGYIPVQDEVLEAFHTREQSSRTLEYAYDDYVLSLFARALGHDSVADDLQQRAANYRNVYNPSLGWVDGRNADGSWVGGDPFSFQTYICEGKPCHYTWYVPHDVAGLVSLMGGADRFAQRLDTVFSGQLYWHGNEPCHQIAYLYNYIGQPWQTQRQVRQIMADEYSLAADGLAGNDDAGQMSAWYIFSALGFYPVCPGTPYYALGSPCFDQVTIHLANGRDFRIVAHDASPQHVYIQSARLNGKPYDLNYLQHDALAQGGLLELQMSAQPNLTRGTRPEAFPPSMTTVANE